MRGQPHLQSTNKRTCGVLDQMRQAVIGHRFAPMAQD
jgi:hypothetical protein